MRNWYLSLILMAATVVFIQGCGVLKKEEGGAAAAVGCQPGQIMSTFWGRCLNQAECPRGLVVSPTQPTMCINPNSGENVVSQQCGAGYTLTTSGCAAQGPCGPGRALVGNACTDGVAGSGNFSGQPQMYGTGAMNPYMGTPYGAQYPGYQQPYAYGAYPRYY